MDLNVLDDLILDNLIKVQKHPTEELFIYNYTPKAQYDRVWNEWTLMCRGLIMDGDGTVVARPFPKFFNWGEIEGQQVPEGGFEVYDKLDGSLGILYWVGDKPFIASRGSFSSPQSDKANELLNTKYKGTIDYLDRDKTYLFEIIFPENRIVVDYGDKEELVLLGIIDTASGDELQLEDVGFPLVQRYDGIKDLNTLHQLQADNKEGFVIKFEGGYRLKVKFEEYVRIHRIITNVSTISIWEYLKEGQSFDGMLDRVPDEFYDWVRTTVEKFEADFKSIVAQAQADYKVLESRKATALYFRTCQYPAVMFNILDGKDPAPTVWKLLRPEFEKPFASSFKEELRGIE